MFQEIRNFEALFIAFPLLIVAAALWSLVWKAVALWHAARRGEKGWFIALLLINTLGILEIIYLFFVAKVNRPLAAQPTLKQ